MAYPNNSQQLWWVLSYWPVVQQFVVSFIPFFGIHHEMSVSMSVIISTTLILACSSKYSTSVCDIFFSMVNHNPLLLHHHLTIINHSQQLISMISHYFTLINHESTIISMPSTMIHHYPTAILQFTKK